MTIPSPAPTEEGPPPPKPSSSDSLPPPSTSSTNPASATTPPAQSVKVAVRVRPLLGKELTERCTSCVTSLSETEILVGTDRRFTFDHVLGQDMTQSYTYDLCVRPLIENLFDGYNATVLAYGQTGSGKTHTMGSSGITIATTTDGTGIETVMDESQGMIPRATLHIFDTINAKKRSSKEEVEFYLRVQFLEVYGEHVRDLLDPTGLSTGKQVSIRDEDGEIQIIGAIEQAVKSPEDMFELLEQGSRARSTGSTDMNQHSSRSHAIFTVILEQHEKEAFRAAKFHFVDLAGSERAKRTNATGKRLQEGININRGLLALGNVISALGDESRKPGQHVPYRDSKLTRMLQDSLGGNSRTLMIACVSPADVNFEETLNALRYANRARNIKNRAVVNMDPTTSQIIALKAQVAQLRAQLLRGEGGEEDPALGTGEDLKDDALRRERARVLEAENQVARLQDALAREKKLRSETQERLDVLISCSATFDALGGAAGEDEPNTLVVRSSDSNALMEDEDMENDEEEEDDSTVQLKAKYTATQTALRRQIVDNESTLKMKQQMMEEIHATRQKYEEMKSTYETKLTEMENEVKETLQQKFALEEKLKDLEAQHHQTEESRNQAIKLRSQLLDKDKRLKELEDKTKQFAELKRAANEAQRKEASVRAEIEATKREKVELAKRHAELTKKHIQEVKERKLEVAGLVRERARLAQEALALAARNERDSKLLSAKSEQVASMQRKLREAQRGTSYGFGGGVNHVEMKRQRVELEKLAADRVQREEELADLRRALAKKEEAIRKRNVLVAELDRLRSEAETALKAKHELEQQQQQQQQPTAPATTEDIRDLEQRLDVVTSEIAFRDGQFQAALLQEDESSQGASASSSGGEIQLTSMEQASQVCRVLMHMLVESKRELAQVKRAQHDASSSSVNASSSGASSASTGDLPPGATTLLHAAVSTTTPSARRTSLSRLSSTTPLLQMHALEEQDEVGAPNTAASRIRSLEEQLKSLQVKCDEEEEVSGSKNEGSSTNALATEANPVTSKQQLNVPVWERLTDPSSYTASHKHRLEALRKRTTSSSASPTHHHHHHLHSNANGALGGGLGNNNNEILVDEMILGSAAGDSPVARTRRRGGDSTTSVILEDNSFTRSALGGIIESSYNEEEEEEEEEETLSFVEGSEEEEEEEEMEFSTLVVDEDNAGDQQTTNPSHASTTAPTGKPGAKRFPGVSAMFADAASAAEDSFLAVSNPAASAAPPPTTTAPNHGWARVAAQTTESYSHKRALDAEARVRSSKSRGKENASQSTTTTTHKRTFGAGSSAAAAVALQKHRMATERARRKGIVPATSTTTPREQSLG